VCGAIVTIVQLYTCPDKRCPYPDYLVASERRLGATTATGSRSERPCCWRAARSRDRATATESAYTLVVEYKKPAAVILAGAFAVSAFDPR
jgi:hypothetical protein